MTERCKSVEVELEFLRIDKEKLEIECDTLKVENKDNLKNTEKGKTELSDVNWHLKKKTEETKNIELGKEFLQGQIKKSKVKADQIDKILNAKNDELAMVENTLKNRDSEIIRLRDELNVVSKAEHLDPHACENCDFIFKTKVQLESHVKEVHEKSCRSCGETFGNNEKLEKHTCRIHIENPSSKHLRIGT